MKKKKKKKHEHNETNDNNGKLKKTHKKTLNRAQLKSV